METIFLIEMKDGKATVLAADHGSKLKAEESLKVLPAMEQAAKGKTGLSEIYSDSHGIHKTAYVSVPGSRMVIGVSSDVGFVEDKINSIVWASIGITLLSLIIGTAAATFMSRRITRPLSQLTAYSNKLAAVISRRISLLRATMRSASCQ